VRSIAAPSLHPADAGDPVNGYLAVSVRYGSSERKRVQVVISCVQAACEMDLTFCNTMPALSEAESFTCNNIPTLDDYFTYQVLK
jgi:hypothetical protein